MMKKYSTKLVNVRVEDLYLDPRNPRIGLSLSRPVWTTEDIMDNSVQDHLLEELKSSYNIRELVQSISSKGYEPAKAPFLVEEICEGKYLVLEGNRRTTALKLLNQKKERGSKIQSIPVTLICFKGSKKDKIDVISELLGDIHISGSMQWGAMEKAKFVYETYMNRIESDTFHWDAKYADTSMKYANLTKREAKQLCGIYVVFCQLRQSYPDLEADIYTKIEWATKASSGKLADYFIRDPNSLRFYKRGYDNFRNLFIDNQICKNPTDMRAFKKIVEKGSNKEMLQAELGDLEGAIQSLNKEQEKLDRYEKLTKVKGNLSEIYFFSSSDPEIARKELEVVDSIIMTCEKLKEKLIN